jgi:hypothetical protein
MDWLRSLVKDESLRNDISYFPQQKHLYDLGTSDRLFDEPVNSDAWWDAQVRFYQSLKMPHSEEFPESNGAKRAISEVLVTMPCLA